MSRTLSDLAQQSIYAAETGDAFIILLTLSDAALAAPICVTSDAVTTISNGVSFMPFPFDLVLPNDMDSKSYRAKLVIDNIDRSIVQAVRSLTTAPSVLIQIVRAATPDVIEAQFVDFNLTNVSYDAYRVQGDLTVEDFTAEPFPAAIFSPGLFPGLF
jgi:hypothetical protein